MKTKATIILMTLMTLAAADSAFAHPGSGIAVDREGQVYFTQTNRKETWKVSTNGELTLIGGVTGMASGPDRSLFVTDGSMLLKISIPGRVSTLMAKVSVSDCPDDLPAPHLRGVPPAPFLRGLAVDSEGSVYVAANRCRAVLKITPDGKATTILRAKAPWSPTGVAVAEGFIYVQEYEFPEAGPRQNEQRPRVRRIGPDGKVTTLAIVGEK